jgi:hypothetical protein
MNTIEILALAFLVAYVSFTLIFGAITLIFKYFGFEYPVYQLAAQKVKGWMFVSEGTTLIVSAIFAIGAAPIAVIIAMLVVSFAQLGVVFSIKRQQEDSCI